MNEQGRNELTFEQKLSSLVYGMFFAGLAGLGVYIVWCLWMMLNVAGALSWLPAWMNPPPEIAWIFVCIAKVLLFVFGLVLLTLFLWHQRVRWQLRRSA